MNACASISSATLAERIVARVFPAGARSVEPGAAGATRFHLVSGAAGPRWLLPVEPRVGLPFIAGWRPYGAASFAMWHGQRLAYRLGLLGRLPRVEPVAVVVSPDASFAHLGWRERTPPVPAVYIGTPGPTRKLVVGLVAAESARMLAVAKIALGPQAAGRIVHEARILERLARDRPGLAPEVVHLDVDAAVLTMAPVPGRLGGRRLTPAHLSLLRTLRLDGRAIPLGERARALGERLGTVDEETADARLVADALRALERRGSLPAFWVHGDLAPWNLMRQVSGELVALDWESSEECGPPLQDLLHFSYHQAHLLGRRPGIQALRERTGVLESFLDDLGIARGHLGDLVRYYLASQWLFRSAAGESAYARTLAADLRALGAGA